MHRAFISTVVATALAFTGITSSMAQASEYRYVQPRSQNHVDPLAATIAGLAALVIVGKAIENNGGFKKKQHHKPKGHVTQNRGHGKKSHRSHRGHGPKTHHGHRGHRTYNNRRGHGWHRHGNGHRHSHSYGPRHHRGRY